MPIPPLNAEGLLPSGLHPCTLEEVAEVFGRFQRSDQRIKLMNKLVEYVEEVRKTKLAVELLIAGSFVTAKQEPEDIDLILVLRPDHDRDAQRPPFEYNVITKKRVRSIYRFDLFVALQGSPEHAETVEFFEKERNRPNVRKGLLRITLP